MPETLFHIRWPDDTAESCYSPSSAIAHHLEPRAYRVAEFVAASRRGLQAASERVREIYGGSCSRATAQLAAIEATARRFDGTAMMHVEAIGGDGVTTDSVPATSDKRPQMGHVPVVVVGGGQAGLSTSWYLKQKGIAHVVIERHRIGHAWRTDRWDAFCLVTPNWQCTLPDFPYAGEDPDGFMLKDEIVAYVEAFARKVDPPIHEGVSVETITRHREGPFVVHTTMGEWTADNVVMAISGYHVPSVPRIGDRFPSSLLQLHSKDYRNPAQMPPGEILVVGTGQSGCQIAEDLHLAGRKVHLAVGKAPRSPRKYRGKDAIKWLDEMGHYDLTIDTHPLGTEVRRKANHYFSGRGGGREIDLRKFATQGVELYGRLKAIEGSEVLFEADLAANLDSADDVYLRIRKMIDDYIDAADVDAPPAEPFVPVWQPTEDRTHLDLAGRNITSVIWATGFRADFSLVDIPVFTDAGDPNHRRGVTPVPGFYFLGLGWLWTWGSGRFSGIAADSRYVTEDIGRRFHATDLSRRPAHRVA